MAQVTTPCLLIIICLLSFSKHIIGITFLGSNFAACSAIALIIPELSVDAFP